jgi:phosphoribosylformylglycinamidine synthase PurS subunit
LAFDDRLKTERRLPMTILVRVFLKPGVLDPQGKAINEALHRLGHADVVDVRAGKIFRLEMEGADPSAALASARKLADQLLANPVIEDFEVELAAAEAAR